MEGESVSSHRRPGASATTRSTSASLPKLRGFRTAGQPPSGASTRIACFGNYCSEVDGIVQLRYFQSLQLYELVEIPVSLFSQILEVGRTHFSADGPTINIPVGKDPPDFTLKLDRSDAKITIANINKHLCLVHGTWQL
jgi:hypothetical protein